MTTPCAVLLFVLLIFLVIVVGQLIMAVRNTRKLQNNMDELDRMLQEEQKFDPVKESEDLLTFTRTFIGQVALLRFVEFKDSHDMSKITRAQITTVVQNVAETVEKALNFANINFDHLLFTREFYDQYIIDFSVDTIKRLTEQEVNNIAGSLSE